LEVARSSVALVERVQMVVDARLHVVDLLLFLQIAQLDKALEAGAQVCQRFVQAAVAAVAESDFAPGNQHLRLCLCHAIAMLQNHVHVGCQECQSFGRHCKSQLAMRNVNTGYCMQSIEMVSVNVSGQYCACVACSSPKRIVPITHLQHSEAHRRSVSNARTGSVWHTTCAVATRHSSWRINETRGEYAK
jgi:hypothetical protein